MLNSERYSIAPIRLGRFDNPQHLSQAQAIADRIRQDILLGDFDPSLAKYKAKVRGVRKPENASELSLVNLWESYLNSKRKVLAQSTLKSDYGNVTRILKRLSADGVNDPKAVSRWIRDNKPPYFAKKLLLQVNACLNHAVERELMPKNPLKKHDIKVDIAKNKQKNDIDPFSAQERDEIIELFCSEESLKPYALLVEFLFSVGCRPSEAIALKWEDVSGGFILFSKAYITGTGLQSGLKTQESRVIRQNTKIADILSRLRFGHDPAKNPMGLVFPGHRRYQHMNWANFSRKPWRRALEGLPHIRHRNPYQMRHTFITLALQAGVSPQDIAKHCGNSATIIYQNYAGVSRNFMMPEF